MIVCKFGGTSVASAIGANNIKNIVKENKNIKFVVVSALGKTDGETVKVTDKLIEIFNLAKNNKPFEKEFDLVIERYKKMANTLKVQIDFDKLKKQILKEFKQGGFNFDYIVSRGEFLSAKLYAKYLNAKFLDAKDYIIFGKNKKVNEVLTKKKFDCLREKLCVIGGFYGGFKDGIVTFSRGGSDITGAILAKIFNAEEYENYTDVEGYFSANPNVFKFSKQLPAISYSSAIKIAYLGGEIVHIDALKLLKNTNVVLRVKNCLFKSGKETIITKNNTRLFDDVFISFYKNYYFESDSFKEKSCFRVIKNNKKYIYLTDIKDNSLKECFVFVIYVKTIFNKKLIKNIKKIEKKLKKYSILCEFLTLNNNFTIVCELKDKNMVIKAINDNIKN